MVPFFVSFYGIGKYKTFLTTETSQGRVLKFANFVGERSFLTDMQRKNLIISILFCLGALIFVEPAFCAGPMTEFICEVGIGYYNQRHYNEALHEFNKALMIEPNNPVAKKYIDAIFKEEITKKQEYARVFARKEDIIDEALDRFEEFCFINPQTSKLECVEYRRGARGAQEDYKAAKFSVSFQGGSFTGDYGDPDKKNTTITYFSETLKYIGKKGTVSLSLPYLLRNGGGVTAGETALAGSGAIPKRADGIGDISLKGEYYWINETDKFPSIDLTARVKFPLANHQRGLGTGRHDFSAGVSLMKRFDQFITLLDMGLVVRQRPNGSRLKPLRFDYSPGFGYAFTQKASGYLFLDSSTISSKDDKKPLELTLAGTYKPQKNLSLNAYLLFGISKSSPDIGAGTGITRYF